MPTASADAFLTELTRVIDYFRAEFDLTYMEAIGCLELTKQQLILETIDDEDDSSD